MQVNVWGYWCYFSTTKNIYSLVALKIAKIHILCSFTRRIAKRTQNGVFKRGHLIKCIYGTHRVNGTLKLVPKWPPKKELFMNLSPQRMFKPSFGEYMNHTHSCWEVDCSLASLETIALNANQMFWQRSKGFQCTGIQGEWCIMGSGQHSSASWWVETAQVQLI